MESLNNLATKVRATDQFEILLLMRGVARQLADINGNLYEFRYYFTFKRTRKAFSLAYNDPYEMPIDNEDFYFDTGDQVVRNCNSSLGKTEQLQNDICTMFAINIHNFHKDEDALRESKRYAPYRLQYKKSKSYKKLMFFYDRALVEYIDYLFKIACAITALNYKIPLVLKKQFLLEESVSLHLLDTDNTVVAMIKETIIGLRADLKNFREVSIDNKILRLPGGIVRSQL